jgi:mycothiol synthase
MPSGSQGPPGSQPAAEITARQSLPAPQVSAVLALAERATREDGVSPLSEHVLLHLRHGGDPGARDLLLRRGEQIVGYAHLDLADQAEGPSGEMLVDPAFRRQGLGRALVQAMVSQSGPHPLRIWAHGDLPAADRLAAVSGFERIRSLYQLRRPLADPLGEPHVPDGIVIRTFQVGQDEDAWTALNHEAFAAHPEQGSWTRADLEVREREPWFDPAGFFLADRDGHLAGFHWTKIHAPADQDDAASLHAASPHGASPDEASLDGGQPEAIGEVYVVGVDPGERGTGLGRALTLIGLRYLRERGLPQVMLYVDGDNTAAVRLYESLGFSRWHTDVMFTSPTTQPHRPGQPDHPGEPRED